MIVSAQVVSTAKNGHWLKPLQMGRVGTASVANGMGVAKDFTDRRDKAGAALVANGNGHG